MNSNPPHQREAQSVPNLVRISQQRENNDGREEPVPQYNVAKSTYLVAEQEHTGLDATPTPPMKSSPSSSLLNNEEPEWLPASLTRGYLLMLAAISLILGLCCFALVAYSHMHNGLADAGLSGGFKFNQRFLPTFVAVLYTLLWSPVVVDVIRTEPWALLSLPTGSMAKDSLLQRDKLWWSHIAAAIRNKKRPGGVRWALLIAVIASLLSSVAINPLSAGMFDTVRLVITAEQQFLGVDASTSSAQAPRIGDITYLRAVTNLLFGVSTSAWNTDEFTVAPFWPSSLHDAPMSAAVAAVPQLWRGKQDVLIARTECQPFTSVRNATKSDGDLKSINPPRFETDDGCAVIQEDWGFCIPSGGVWGSINPSTSGTKFSQCIAKGYREYFLFCSNETSTNLPHSRVSTIPVFWSGQVCSTSYLAADVPVNVSTTSSGTKVSFDQASFSGAQRPMEARYLNMSDFENEFIRQTGSNHLRPTRGFGYELPNTQQNSNLKGPALVLATTTGYNISRLMQMDPKQLAQRASVIKQRFLGEVLLSNFDTLAKSQSTRSFIASMTTSQTRLMVDLGIGISIGILFIMLTGAATSLAFLVTLNKRPLQLLEDPSKASTAASSSIDRETSTSFKGLDRALPAELDNTLKDRAFLIRSGRLLSVDKVLVPQASKSSRRSATPRFNWLSRHDKAPSETTPDWRPFTLRRRSGSLLTLLLLCVTAALVAVYVVSRKRPLYQSAFVYESDIKLGKLNVTTLAPYSIIPTVVAVAIKLWWGTIDSAHRRLAPFLVMARDKAPKSTSLLNTTYISTPILWVPFKALRKGFWLLALVTVGSLMSEVLQISMSALWSRELGTLVLDTTLTNQFELRSTPHVFQDFEALYLKATNIAYPNIAQKLYGGDQYQTSWIYGSLAELTFGASPPAWSKGGWNIPPIDLSATLKTMPKLSSKDKTRTAEEDLASALNVTFDSIGVRGRIECDTIHDTSPWIFEVKNLTGLLPYDNSSNLNRPVIRTGFEFSPEVRIVDFTNPNVSQPLTVAIGEWLHYNYSSSRDRGETIYYPERAQNFTVLWTNASYPYLFETNITGVPKGVFQDAPPPPRLVFAEKPQIQALTCWPIFESAKMSVTVSPHDGKIQDYTVLEPPKPAEDAWTDKFRRHFSNETYYYEPKQTGSNGLGGVLDYNSTVSWGYLFQLALLQACNSQGFVTSQGDILGDGIPGPTPFSFLEPDLYSDPYSYAALSLVDYNRTALLNATTLTTVTQRVFSTFFQWFVSSKSGYTGDYWVYQPIGASLPQDLDFGATESLWASTSTGTRAETLCASSWSSYERTEKQSGVTVTKTYSVEKCARPTLTSYSTYTVIRSGTTIQDTRITPSQSSSRSIGSTATSISQTLSDTAKVSGTASKSSSFTSSASMSPATTARARLRRQASTTNPRTIQAKVSVQTETLVVSATALFLSVAILIILIASTFVIYIVQHSQLQLLPRDFDSPASLLAAVYASERLKAWTVKQHEEQAATKNNSRSEKRGHLNVDDDVKIGMGYFTGVDGEEHWGIEVQEDYPLLMGMEGDGGNNDEGSRAATRIQRN